MHAATTLKPATFFAWPSSMPSFCTAAASTAVDTLTEVAITGRKRGVILQAVALIQNTEDEVLRSLKGLPKWSVLL